MTSAPSDPAGREQLLAEGELQIVGRVMDSSNATLVVDVTRGDDYGWGIYKPLLGEAPLWDFEPGLYRRERAAYLLSEEIGWSVVPPTIVREDAPVGVGSLQWFVEADGQHYFTLLETEPDTHDALRRLAVFDIVVNNADRKAGHVLRDGDGRVWAIDHGLCFAAETKLRTVIWDFGGEPVDDALLGDIAFLATDVPDAVAELLDDAEVVALKRRVRRLLQRPFLPLPTTNRHYPWPLV
ncbi:SCO1664 family protein [Nigerium massiliense]|uniref:SCO1664 family protein n=1 Tax=Nigerium massiliense TaxID=1522317 RepID=UPI00058EBF05|nr:SCO1664 family protein [Nigerium massiliense]